jgi:DNA ligase-1
MSKPFKPLLSGKVTDLTALKYPVIASPKLDGIRAVIKDGQLLARSLKSIPNKALQEVFSRAVFNGLDGELVVGPPNASDAYNVTVSEVMSHNKPSEATFYVFDCFNVPDEPFHERIRDAYALAATYGAPFTMVEQMLIDTPEQLAEYEAQKLAEGYEGVMVRDPDGPYKFGRSTDKQGILLKLKVFEDAEAKVVGFVEQMHNTNEAKKNALGQTERSTSKAGMVPMGMMGTLVCQEPGSDITFEIGTGFTVAQREQIWQNQDSYLGKQVKFKHQPHGRKDRPRLPVFLGWRDPIDMG